MKPFIVILFTSSALVSCAPHTVAERDSAARMTNKPATVGQPSARRLEKADGYASAPVGENSYEFTYSGPWVGSRDEVEGSLLYRAALLARQHGKMWFRFLHMPGEAGPLSHPKRQAPSFGAEYGHWQPHWSYSTASGWQYWHPEWGSAFWAETPDGRRAERVAVHAMIELGVGSFSAAEQTDFDVSAVLRDLRPAPE